MSAADAGASLDGAITYRTYARAGLFGNPSDQYGGQTIALSLANFYAEVTLTPSSDPTSTAIHIQPNPVYDNTKYRCLDDLVKRTAGEGLYGGVRLLTATCKRFAEYCAQHGITLHPGKGRRSDKVDGESSASGSGGGGGGFALSYNTTVPRQTGLAGSSAIIYSALKCLMEWYGIDEDQLPYWARPGLILSVESEELGIAAGLQDRVVQVYGGVVHMDFDPDYMKERGGIGRYSRLQPGLLPQPLYIMYSENPSESGKVHSGVKAKWLAGDPEVRALMTRVAQCGATGLRLLLSAVEGPQTLTAEDARRRDRQLADLMNDNFDLRHALFGDAVLGVRNLRMVALARSVGAGVNFTGSGGAVVVFCPGGEQQAASLKTAAEAEGFTLVLAQVGPEEAHLPPPPFPPAGAAAERALAAAELRTEATAEGWAEQAEEERAQVEVAEQAEAQAQGRAVEVAEHSAEVAKDPAPL